MSVLNFGMITPLGGDSIGGGNKFMESRGRRTKKILFGKNHGTSGKDSINPSLS
jgi:hypothetical protein